MRKDLFNEGTEPKAQTEVEYSVEIETENQTIVSGNPTVKVESEVVYPSAPRIWVRKDLFDTKDEPEHQIDDRTDVVSGCDVVHIKNGHRKKESPRKWDFKSLLENEEDVQMNGRAQ